mmetsp:Transcript_129137/g.251450  ORF Transcript_129137/g.251450 Transcript_129137/m.251450 type:complete len:558 (+) Transcript_129137:29-1702(+)
MDSGSNGHRDSRFLAASLAAADAAGVAAVSVAMSQSSNVTAPVTIQQITTEESGDMQTQQQKQQQRQPGIASDDSEVATFLKQIGACRFCTLRVQGFTDMNHYFRHNFESASVASVEGQGRPVSADTACGLCLGLLEGSAEQLRSKLAARLQQENYEGQLCTLNVSLPVLCTFRQQLLLARLRCMGQPQEDACADTKDILRWLLSDILTSLGMSMGSVAEYPQEAGVICVNISGEYKGSAVEELACLESQQPRGGGRKRRKLEAKQQQQQQQQQQSVSAAMVLSSLANRDAAACLEIVGGNSLNERLGRIQGQAMLVVDIGREGLYLSGRYVKLSRRIPQSPWIIDGERKGESSVEELVTGPLAKLFGAKETRFHAEGREDIDVRMLGSGRPFVVELRNAKKTSPSCSEAEAAVNVHGRGAVSIRCVELCAPSAMAALQRDAENHTKTYICVCWSAKALTSADVASLCSHHDLEVQQKTPLRVLHRRAPAVRPKTVHWMELELVNSHFFKLRLSTQAGMYIKEFVHGDLGRTRPSVRSLLGARVEILQLDVQGVEEA